MYGVGEDLLKGVESGGERWWECKTKPSWVREDSWKKEWISRVKGRVD
jgi:hypothetical protein